MAAIAYWALRSNFASFDLVPDRTLATVHLVVVWVGVVLISATWLLIRRNGKCVSLALSIMLVLSAFDALCTAALTWRTRQYEGPEFAKFWRDLEQSGSRSITIDQAPLHRDLMHDLGPYVTNKHILLRRAMMHGYGSMHNSRHYQLTFTTGKLHQIATGGDRIWYSPHALVVSPSQANFEIFMNSLANGGLPPSFVHQREDMLTHKKPSNGDPPIDLAVLPIARQIPVSVLEYRPTALRLNVTAPFDGWLFVTDRWAAGWKVAVNGTPQIVHGGMFVFRAVEVRKGVNVVDFRYKPFGYPMLVLCSGLTFAAVWLRAPIMRGVRFILQTRQGAHRRGGRFNR
jgi:hypothetical protein